MVKGKAPIVIALAVVAAGAAGLLARGHSAAHAERGGPSLRLVELEPLRDVRKQPFSAALLNPAVTQTGAATLEAIEARDGLVITRQRFQRAGLGSQVRTSFTIENRNPFAVKDVAMHCDFAGPDGRYVSARDRTVSTTLPKNSRKQIGSTHVGFVSATMSQARCSIISANRA